MSKLKVILIIAMMVFSVVSPAFAVTVGDQEAYQTSSKSYTPPKFGSNNSPKSASEGLIETFSYGLPSQLLGERSSLGRLPILSIVAVLVVIVFAFSIADGDPNAIASKMMKCLIGVFLVTAIWGKNPIYEKISGPIIGGSTREGAGKFIQLDFYFAIKEASEVISKKIFPSDSETIDRTINNIQANVQTISESVQCGDNYRCKEWVYNRYIVGVSDTVENPYKGAMGCGLSPSCWVTYFVSFINPGWIIGIIFKIFIYVSAAIVKLSGIGLVIMANITLVIFTLVSFIAIIPTQQNRFWNCVKILLSTSLYSFSLEFVNGLTLILLSVLNGAVRNQLTRPDANYASLLLESAVASIALLGIQIAAMRMVPRISKSIGTGSLDELVNLGDDLMKGAQGMLKGVAMGAMSAVPVLSAVSGAATLLKEKAMGKAKSAANPLDRALPNGGAPKNNLMPSNPGGGDDDGGGGGISGNPTTTPVGGNGSKNPSSTDSQGENSNPSDKSGDPKKIEKKEDQEATAAEPSGDQSEVDMNKSAEKGEQEAPPITPPTATLPPSGSGSTNHQGVNYAPGVIPDSAAKASVNTGSAPQSEVEAQAAPAPQSNPPPSGAEPEKPKEESRDKKERIKREYTPPMRAPKQKSEPSVMDDLKADAKNKFPTLTAKISDMASKLSGGFGKADKWVSEKSTNASKAVGDKVSGVADKVGSAVSNQYNKLPSGLKDGVSKTGEVLGGLAGKAGDKLGAAADVAANIGQAMAPHLLSMGKAALPILGNMALAALSGPDGIEKMMDGVSQLAGIPSKEANAFVEKEKTAKIESTMHEMVRNEMSDSEIEQKMRSIPFITEEEIQKSLEGLKDRRINHTIDKAAYTGASDEEIREMLLSVDGEMSKREIQKQLVKTEKRRDFYDEAMVKRNSKQSDLDDKQ